MGVVLYHADEGHHMDQIMAAVPALKPWFGQGGLGVQVFFVLSGFVIAHSLAKHQVTLGFFLRFLLRRSVRLDPPYWASMVVMVAFGLLSARIVPGKVADIPSLGRVLVHVLYLQDLLQVPALASVYWTLCLEIQFYLVFALLMMVVRVLRQRMSYAKAFYTVLLPAVAFALLWPARLAPFEVPGLFLNQWFSFLMGVLAWGAAVGFAQDRIALPAAGVAFAVLAVLGLIHGGPVELVAAGISALIVLAGRLGKLSSWLNYRPLLTLGAISYSIYLIHNPITGAAYRVGYRLTGRTLGTEVLWFFLVLLGAVMAAYLFHRAVERPALELSRRVSLSGRKPGLTKD